MLITITTLNNHNPDHNNHCDGTHHQHLRPSQAGQLFARLRPSSLEATRSPVQSQPCTDFDDCHIILIIRSLFIIVPQSQVPQNTFAQNIMVSMTSFIFIIILVDLHSF